MSRHETAAAKAHDDRLDKRLSKPIEYFTDADKFNIAMAVATGKKDPKDILVMQPKLTDQMMAVMLKTIGMVDVAAFAATAAGAPPIGTITATRRDTRVFQIGSVARTI